MPKTWTFFALKMLEMIVWHGLHTYTASPTYTLAAKRQRAEGKKSGCKGEA